MNGKKIRIQMMHGVIARPWRQKQTLRGLGLRRIGQIRELENTAAIRGMLKRVPHLVRILGNGEKI